MTDSSTRLTSIQVGGQRRRGRPKKEDAQSNLLTTNSSSSNLHSQYRKNFKQAFSPIPPRNYKGKGKGNNNAKIKTEANTKYKVQRANKDFKIISYNNEKNNLVQGIPTQKNLIDLDMDVVEIPVLQEEVKS